MTSREAEISQGRAIMAAVVGSYATASVLTVVFGSQRFDEAKDIITFVIQTSLTTWLFYMMWTGRQWARWTISALFALGIIIVLVSTISSFNWRLGLFLAYQAALPLLLCFPTSVDTFIDEQKRKRTEPIQAPQTTTGSSAPDHV